jgi:hypothetical protein
VPRAAGFSSLNRGRPVLDPRGATGALRPCAAVPELAGPGESYIGQGRAQGVGLAC